jgi:hypothetical protein
MCNPALFMLGMAAVQGYTSIEQGKAAEDMGEYQQDQANADADAAKGAAQVDASIIRRQARRTTSAANAQMAANGVDITGGGTAEEINKDISTRAETDAQMGIFGAADRASRINAQGEADKIAGEQKKDASYIDAATTLGSAVVKTDWKTM